LLGLCHADGLRAGPDSVGRVANYGVEDRSVRGKHRRVHILHPEVRKWQAIILEIRIYVKLLDLIESLDLVLGLPSDSIALDHPYVQVTTEYEGAEVLQGGRDAPCADEWIVHEITSADLSLVCHEERQLVVSRRWSQVRPQLQIILGVIGLVLVFVVLSQWQWPAAGNPLAKVEHVVGRIIKYLVDKRVVLQIHQVPVEWQVLKQLDDLSLSLGGDFPADAFNLKPELLLGVDYLL